MIFMSLEEAGRGAIGFRIIRNAPDSQHFHGLGMGGKGAACLRIIRNMSFIIFVVLKAPATGAFGSRIMRNT